jgi:hypothetical protein
MSGYLLSAFFISDMASAKVLYLPDMKYDDNPYAKLNVQYR